MCLSPITIPNQSKYLSLRYRDQYLMSVPCGHCSECQKSKSNEWYLRSWFEFDRLPSDGYVLFDTLTYRPKHLPHLSSYWSMLSPSEDFPCFDYMHIRNFLEALRLCLKRLGYGNCIRHFVASEYGTHKNYTHRPHYHLMLYVSNPALHPFTLSRLISKYWKYGRTDGLPYKKKSYVLDHNVISPSSSNGSKYRTIKYITKYVTKSCQFTAVINDRVDKVMSRLADYATADLDLSASEWLETEFAHRERLKLLRYVNQFHRQSHHFGENALESIDLNDLSKTGCLFIPGIIYAYNT